MSTKRWSMLVALVILLTPAFSFAFWHQAPGAVYTMSNDAEENTVLVFARSANGGLTLDDEVATGGKGTGAGLGNQGGVILSEGKRFLFVVNAGSNDISVLAVLPWGLKLLGTYDSGGLRPISLTIDRRVLYVLNAGGSAGDNDNITGFRVGLFGKLWPISDSTRPLSASDTDPAQVEFSRNGRVLVVTEKATNLIDTYAVGRDGRAEGPNVFDSAGDTPFGFAFGKGNYLFVSEAAAGAADAGSVSSYRVFSNGNLDLISDAVPTTETAACWVLVTDNGRYAYTTNAGSGSISGYAIARDGSISLLDPDGRTGDTGDGSGPIDMALSRNSRYLYTLNGGNNTITGFRVKFDGALVPLASATVDSLPSAANGLAAR